MTQARITIDHKGSLPIDEKVLADLIASIGVDAIDAQIENVFDLFFESVPNSDGEGEPECHPAALGIRCARSARLERKL